MRYMRKGKKPMTIAVLGGNGMLGSVVLNYLQQEANKPDSQIAVAGFMREHIDAANISQESLNELLEGFDWVINCIGIIKPHIKGDAEEAIRVNALFPHLLKKVPNTKVIQIATDCVFSGKNPNPLDESEPHDPNDIYGMTKSLGEAINGDFYNLRCSIIGPKPGNKSLMEWFLGQEEDSEVHGYTNHLWNGITTLAFAKLCLAVINNGGNEVLDQHIVPSDVVTKYELLTILAEEYHRTDITIHASMADQPCNRILGTIHKELNERLWKEAGYESIPTIRELVIELKQIQTEGD